MRQPPACGGSTEAADTHHIFRAGTQPGFLPAADKVGTDCVRPHQCRLDVQGTHSGSVYLVPADRDRSAPSEAAGNGTFSEPCTASQCVNVAGFFCLAARNTRSTSKRAPVSLLTIIADQLQSESPARQGRRRCPAPAGAPIRTTSKPSCSSRRITFSTDGCSQSVVITPPPRRCLPESRVPSRAVLLASVPQDVKINSPGIGLLIPSAFSNTARARSGADASCPAPCRGGRISEDLHRLQHGGFSLLTQRRGRAVVQIMPCLHRLTPS